MKNFNSFLAIIYCVCMIGFIGQNYATAQIIESTGHHIIPHPKKYCIDLGKFQLSSSTVLLYENEDFRFAAEDLAEFLKNFYGLQVIISTKKNKWKNIIKLCDQKLLPKEGYHLTVRPDNIILSGSPEGVFRGVQTIKQLITKNENKLLVYCCTIEDHPAFKWRGMHLDVARHFFTPDEVCRYIDFLAFYKMNTFHWHLTDDQGWRIEIKKYPELTRVGAWRNATLKGHYNQTPHQYDSTRYGGYYTQEDIKRIVKYAEQRFITIVPEIEMPGHCLAALAAYPQYSCTGGPFAVQGLWGVFDDVFCAKEETFSFLQDVLSEVIELFPGKYIHIGGDECPKTRWKQCPVCQKVIRDNGLKNEHELQSYFIKRIEKFLSDNGKTLIGWDEILEGGLAPNAIVMSWRGMSGGIEAALSGHYVVMSPGSHCYFDHYQGSPISEPLAIGGNTNVEKVYSFNPIPNELNSEQRKFILGAQANLWTEYISTFKQVEYMIFPRMPALAEVLWSYPDDRNFDEFFMRLLWHFDIWKDWKINYSKAVYEVSVNTMPLMEDNTLMVMLTSKAAYELHYTLDNSELTIKSPVYINPLLIKQSCRLQAAVFKRNGEMLGWPVVRDFHFNKATGKEINFISKPDDRYNNKMDITLVDGILGQLPWNAEEWLGFKGKDMEVLIDLKDPQKISNVTVDVLEEKTSWIYLPKEVIVEVSLDGTKYINVGKLNQQQIIQMKRAMKLEFTPIEAQYVKIIVRNAGIIPECLPGEGNPAWLFVDEISIE